MKHTHNGNNTLDKLCFFRHSLYKQASMPFVLLPTRLALFGYRLPEALRLYKQQGNVESVKASTDLVKVAWGLL